MNPLLDKEFLKDLNEHRSHEIYARITALSVNELPIEEIEGKVTSGSINIDGTSAVRRTCSLSMVASDVDVNGFYWGLHNKFKLEIGLKNEINSSYPDIIWFRQGIYVITSFNTSLSTSGFNISISGKDKMCLLNGEIGGSLPASIDFGVEEYVDLENEVTTYTDVPLEKIIREAVHAYGLEPYHNIIINDLDESGLELLEYRGEDPAYLLYLESRGEYTDIKFDGDITCYDASSGKKLTLATIPNYNKRIDSLVDDFPTKIQLVENGNIYTVSKLEYGQTAGYRITDLVYSGDLISNIGESLTSIIDKIVTMLGNYEYFYNLDGQFIFQKKKIYVDTPWTGITTIEDDTYTANNVETEELSYNFEGNNLIRSFSNTPTLTNIRNDFTIWGKRKSVSGAELPIHYRYAIHHKPEYYKNVAGVEYTAEEYDWRELIYQMALDYYQYDELGVKKDDNTYIPLNLIIKANNPNYYPSGYTGYEQFYLDMQGFWRELYNPTPTPKYYKYSYSTKNESYFNPVDDNGEEIEQLFLKEKYTQLNAESVVNRADVLVLCSYDGELQLQEFIDTIPVNYDFDEEGNQREEMYYITADNDEGFKAVNKTISYYTSKEQLYIKVNDEYKTLISSWPLTENCYLVEELENDEYLPIEELPSAIQALYISKDGYNKYYLRHQLDDEAQIQKDIEPERQYLSCYVKYYDYFTQGQENQYWRKEVKEEPDSLNFWIDFLDSVKDGYGSELDSYSIPTIGDRSKVINDDKVTSIYFRDIPNLIFTTYSQLEVKDLKDKTGYQFMFLPQNIIDPSGSAEFNYFTISTQGKSAKEELDSLLYTYSYCIDSVNISTIPIYYLEPNTRIAVRDDNSKINGEYLINRISIPLTYNGTMTITASKAPERVS